MDDHAHLLTPEQEQQFFSELGRSGDWELLNNFFQFPQTKWDECFEEITGNYEESTLTYNCVSNRGISVILKKFLFEHFPRCVDRGLAAVNAQPAQYIHLSHSGILADKAHSPKSLHSEQRAIDLRVLRVRFYNGAETSFVYGNENNHNFFEEIRRCWGEVLIQNNDCPINESLGLTGSIGREDSGHQSHAHFSVPYCINGQYAGSYFKR